MAATTLVELPALSAVTTPAPGALRDRSPSWSPDGSRKSPSSEAEMACSHAGAFVMRSDGTGPIRSIVSLGKHRFEGTAWSPDGTTIAVTYNYVTGAHCTSILYAADGSGGRPALLGQRNGADNISNRPEPIVVGRLDPHRVRRHAQHHRESCMPPCSAKRQNRHRLPTPPFPIGQNGMWLANVPPSSRRTMGGDLQPLTPAEHHVVVVDGIEPLVLAGRHPHRLCPRWFHLEHEGHPRLRRDRPGQPRRPRKRSELGPVSRRPMQRASKVSTARPSPARRRRRLRA